jgi:hypothetical protein
LADPAWLSWLGRLGLTEPAWLDWLSWLILAFSNLFLEKICEKKYKKYCLKFCFEFKMYYICIIIQYN